MPIYRVPVQGLTRLAASIGGGDAAYNHGYQNESQAQSAMGRAIAEARAKNAEADQLEQQYNMRTPEAIRRNAMLGSGVPLGAAPDVDEFFNTGRIARTSPLPAGQQGPVDAVDPWQKNLGNVGRQIQSLQNALTLGDKNSLNVAKSNEVYDNLNKRDRIIGGELKAGPVGEAIAAVEGKALVSPQEFGSVNLFTGRVDDSGGAAQRFGKKRVSESAENYAQANNANASAAANLADRDLKRSKIGQAQTTTLPDGTTVSTGTPPKLTELQGKASLFGSRAAEADAILNEIGGDYSPVGLNAKTYAENAPLVGGALGMVGNSLLSENSQRVEQAQRDFVNAVLRLESGAAIAESEFQNAKKQYFPQPNDKPGQIEQKRRNRETAIRGLRMMAGPAADAVQPRNDAPKPIIVDY